MHFFFTENKDSSLSINNNSHFWKLCYPRLCFLVRLNRDRRLVIDFRSFKRTAVSTRKRVDKYYVCRAASFVVRYMQSINKVSDTNDSSLSLLLNCTVKSYQLSQMDCAQLKSIVSLVDSLVRNTPVRRSRVLPSNQVPVGAPSLASVSSKSLTDFSICSILGLEREITNQSPSSFGKLKVPSSDTRALN